MTRKQIIEIFQALTLAEKESLLTELQRMVTIEKNSPPKSPLEIAWKEIQRNIKMLSFYSYIDDQIEITMIWDICEDLIKSDVLKNEAWDLKEKILKEIMKNSKDWRERLLLKMFPRTFVKVYHAGRIKGFNYIVK